MNIFKWLLYTIVLSLMPVILKGIVSWTIDNCPKEVSFWCATDWNIFAFLLNITTINAIEVSEIDGKFKSGIISTGITFIVLLSGLYFVILFDSHQMLKDGMHINQTVIGIITLIFTIGSIILNFITFKKLRTN